jgi:hypothetical protein
MKLIDLSPADRTALAKRVGANAVYLYQVAVGFRNKRASPDLCRRLVAAEPRLTLAELRPDIWGDVHGSPATATQEAAT